MLIVYGSRYGHAKRYAEEFARRTGGEAVSYKELRSAEEETVVCFGGVYAGGIKGLARVVRRLNAAKVSLFLVATVGLSDPSDEKNGAGSSPRRSGGCACAAAAKAAPVPPARRHRLCRTVCPASLSDEADVFRRKAHPARKARCGGARDRRNVRKSGRFYRFFCVGCDCGLRGGENYVILNI